DLKQVLATQTVWRSLPASVRLHIEGHCPQGVYAKDVALAVIRTLGTSALRGKVIEFCGPYIDRLGIEARMTLCNMSIESGAMTGIIAADSATMLYLKQRPSAPSGPWWEAAEKDWIGLFSDAEAAYAGEFRLEASSVPPTVTWGTGLDQAAPI